MVQNSNNSGCLSAIGYVIKTIVTRIIGFLVIIFFYSIIVGIVDVVSSIGNDKKPVTSPKVVNTKKTTTTKKTNNKVYSNYAYWKDNYGHSHAESIKVKETDYFSSVGSRRSLSIYDTWEYMARKVIRNDRYRLDMVYKTFENIRRNNNFSRYQFADIIVSFVQDIPYSIITNSQDIYAPVEFIKKYTGDCDTRTVFLYLMLRKFDYDVVILNSVFYAHSILGINLATSGVNYKYHNGMKYYAWETTNKGYKRGLLHSKVSNMYMWDVTLSN